MSLRRLVCTPRPLTSRPCMLGGSDLVDFVDKAGRHQQLPNIMACVTTHVVHGSIVS